ncbi:MAG: PilN domain-containing protein [Thainema sp.]
MYNLDINFLNDREERPIPAGAAAGAATPAGDRTPIFIGAAVAIALLAAVGGAWLFTNQQIASLTQQNQDLDNQLSDLQARQDRLDEVRLQTAAIQEETQALTTIFNQIRPWSAMLQDVRERIPGRVQINEIVQTTGIPRESPETEDGIPPSSGGVEIIGVACSFDDINDFILTLQRSPYFIRNETELVSAELGEDDDNQVPGRCPGDPTTTQAVQLVNYTIQANLTEVPASELIDAFERSGTIGLIARIRALQDIGAIEP